MLSLNNNDGKLSPELETRRCWCEPNAFMEGFPQTERNLSQTHASPYPRPAERRINTPLYTKHDMNTEHLAAYRHIFLSPTRQKVNYFWEGSMSIYSTPRGLHHTFQRASASKMYIFSSIHLLSI